MSIAAIVRANLSQFADFRGRSSREEFWCFFLVGVLAAQSMSLLTGSLSSIFPAFGSSMLSSPPFMVRGLLLLPFLAAAARRLRDCGKSPWWLCLALPRLLLESWELATFLMADYAFGGPLMYPLAEICLVILLFLLTAERRDKQGVSVAAGGKEARVPSVTTAVKLCLRRCLLFRGRASRAEFWWFVLAWQMLALFLESQVLILSVLLGSHLVPYGPAAVRLACSAFCILPLCAAGARRLHDRGMPGWWMLLGLPSLIIAPALAFWAPLEIWGGKESARLFQLMLRPELNMPQLLSPLVQLAASCLLLSLYWLLTVDGAAGPNRYGPDSLEGEPGRRARVLVFRESGPDRPEPARRVRRNGGRRPARSLSAARGWRMLNFSDQF